MRSMMLTIAIALVSIGSTGCCISKSNTCGMGCCPSMNSGNCTGCQDGNAGGCQAGCASGCNDCNACGSGSLFGHLAEQRAMRQAMRQQNGGLLGQLGYFGTNNNDCCGSCDGGCNGGCGQAGGCGANAQGGPQANAACLPTPRIGCGAPGCGVGGRPCPNCLAAGPGRRPPAVSPYGGVPHTPSMGPASGSPTPTYSYPYYTTRAPRDFLMANPPSIGW